VRVLHPDIDADGVVDLGELGVALVNAQSDADAAQALLTELKSRTLDAMGNAKTAVVDDHVVATRSARNGGTPFLTIKK
jgi:microcystin degradation protein MlrC